MNVLELDDVTVDLPRANGLSSLLLPGSKSRFNILDQITFLLRQGETLGVVGESGSGKTTLARAILGLTPLAGGSVKFMGTELKSTQSFVQLRKSAAMMFQDATASLSPRMTVGSLITEPFIIHRAAMPDRRAKAIELLDRVGLSPAFALRYPQQLSGGQARRVGVARALALSPELVIADEPTAGLDVSIQGEILNLMSDVQKQMQLSYLIITHNLALIRHTSQSIAVMYLGRLVETGPTRSIFAGPLHPYTMGLLASEPKPDPRRRRKNLAISGEVPSFLARPSGCEFHPRCPLAQDVCKREAPQLRSMGQGRMVKCHFAENS